MASTETASDIYKIQSGGLVSQRVSARAGRELCRFARLTGDSGTGRDIQLRRIRLCARYPGDSPRRTLSTHWCCARLILSGRTTRPSGKDWLRDMSHRFRHYRATCPARQRGPVRRGDLEPRPAAWYVYIPIIQISRPN